MVADALSRKSMGVLAHLAVQRRTLGLEIQKLANDGIRLDETKEDGIIAYALAQSSLVAHVKANQDEDLWSEKGHNGRSSQLEVLYPPRCYQNVSGLERAVLVESHEEAISIISDRGPQFTTYFWQAFQKRLGSKVNLSTTFHPQTDDQVSIGMAPYEALYGRRYKSPVGWFEPAEVPLIGPEFVCEALEKV
nr:uncharacterized protein LOC117276818 [Nicotiana tomentosiformis]